MRNQVPVLLRQSLVRVKWAKEGAFGRLRRFRVMDAVDQKGETEHVRQKDEFLD